MGAARRYADIQVLRAIACLMVILHHVSITHTTHTTLRTLPGELESPFWMGVELFFVISGFVVTRSLLGKNTSAVAFLLRRFFRLTPAIIAFLAFSLCTFLLIGWFGNQAQADALRFTGAQAFFSQSAQIIFGVLINISEPKLYYFSAMWSLSVEYQFYAAFAAVVAVLALSLRTKTSLKTALLAISLTALAVLYAVRVIGFLAPDVNAFVPYTVHYLLNWRFDFLLMGVALQLAPDRIRDRLALPGGIWLAALVTLAIPLALGSVSESQIAPHRPFLDGITLPVAGPLLIVLVASAARSSAPTAGPLYRAMVWLGDRSYSMYLFHFPVMAFIWLGVANITPSIFFVSPWAYPGLQVVLTYAITIFLADLTYRYIEVPYTAVGDGLSERYVRWLEEREEPRRVTSAVG